MHQQQTASTLLTPITTKYRSSPNIAWIKYWGKYNEDYILPLNDSLGVTLNSEDLYTETTVIFSPGIAEHGIALNGSQSVVSGRMRKMFQFVKSRAYERVYQGKVSSEEWGKCHFAIESRNSFPTASGMASSASGLACLAAALNGLFGNILTEVELSELARLGSGSASRSIYGGLVRWKGIPLETHNTPTTEPPQQSTLQYLSKECISFTVVPHTRLTKFRILILLANDKEKQMSSTTGMQISANTSELIQYRNQIARRRIQDILAALGKLEQLESSPSQPSAKQQQQITLYNSIAQTTIKDSNQFHAICLDTYPPIFYLSQFSKQIISLIDHTLNPVLKYKIAYTFDAGPHAFLFIHQEVEGEVLGFFGGLFGLGEGGYNRRAWHKLTKWRQQQKQADNQTIFKKYEGPIIKPYQIWSTSIGPGAHKIQ